MSDTANGPRHGAASANEPRPLASAASRPRPVADIAFAAVVIVFAGLVYWGTLELPPPRYEPMGSAALPRALAVIMALLALFVGARGVMALRAARGHKVGEAEALPYRKRPALAAATVVLLAAYLVVLEQRWLGFVPASIVAFSFFGAMLSGFEPKRSLRICAFTIAIVIACYLVFTHLFYVDLP